MEVSTPSSPCDLCGGRDPTPSKMGIFRQFSLMCVFTTTTTRDKDPEDKEDDDGEDDEVGVVQSLCPLCMKRVDTILSLNQALEKMKEKLRGMVGELREEIKKIRETKIKESVSLSIRNDEKNNAEVQMNLVSKVHSYARTTTTPTPEEEEEFDMNNVMICDSDDNDDNNATTGTGPDQFTPKDKDDQLESAPLNNQPGVDNSLLIIRKACQLDPSSFAVPPPPPNAPPRKRRRAYKTKNQNMQQCPHCPRRLRCPVALNGHIHKVHEGDTATPYHCTHPTCSRKFKSSSHFTVHLYSHAPEKRWKCEQCGKGFTMKLSLIRHREECHPPTEEDGGFKCKEADCGEVFSRRSELIRHMSETHGAEWPEKCPHSDCGKGLTSRSELRKHLVTHKLGAELPYPCTLCEKKFANPSYLTRHLESHTEKKWMCETCGKQYKSLSSLQRHELYHKEGVEKLKCTKCPKEFVTKKALHHHKMTSHGEKTLKCDYCPRMFLFKHQLQYHMKLHQGIKDYLCHDCGNCFPSTHRLNVHRRVHLKGGVYVQKPRMGDLEKMTKGLQNPEDPPVLNLGDELALSVQGIQQEVELSSSPFTSRRIRNTGSRPRPSARGPLIKCPNCARKFLTSEALNAHIRSVHEGNPTPYHCLHEGCELKFSKYVLLHNHSLTHTPRIWSCKECGDDQDFLSKQTLRTHIKNVHTPPRIWSCKECGDNKDFLSKQRLRTHIKNVHRASQTRTREEKIFTCKECRPEVTFRCRSSFKRHMISTHPESYGSNWSTSCPDCGKGFLNQQEVRKHHAAVHSRDVWPCPYPGCGKQFESKRALGRHHTCSHGGRNFRCSMCPRSFGDLKLLKKHMMTFHDHKKGASASSRRSVTSPTRALKRIQHGGKRGPR